MRSANAPGVRSQVRTLRRACRCPRERGRAVRPTSDPVQPSAVNTVQADRVQWSLGACCSEQWLRVVRAVARQAAPRFRDRRPLIRPVGVASRVTAVTPRRTLRIEPELTPPDAEHNLGSPPRPKRRRFSVWMGRARVCRLATLASRCPPDVVSCAPYGKRSPSGNRRGLHFGEASGTCTRCLTRPSRCSNARLRQPRRCGDMLSANELKMASVRGAATC